MMDRSRFDADVLEWELPVSVVDALLVDHAVGKAWHNIRWCTKDYERYGIGFGENDEMRSMQIMDREHSIIQPRSLKAKEEQRRRSVERAEVFTPSWICNKQNNLVDAAWFHSKGKSSPFNREIDRKDGTHSWVTSRENIQFPHGLKWFDYVTANRLEVSCGEAPYLTSRYDTVTGKYIEPHDRIGLLDRDVFEDAGIQIRKLAKSAEKLPPGQRVQQIARIFSYFKNPDKETVLTPWRVVNMHMSDTLGGWCFFNDVATAPSPSGSERGRAVSMKPPLAPFSEPLDEPRFVDRGDVTDRVFRSASKILEINSKSGIYPLYVAYSIYRRKCGEIPEQDIAAPTREKKWRETVKDNVFVICKTPMAASITRRTLVGYSTAAVNAIYVDNLIDTLKSAPEKFIKKITKGDFWKREEEEMKFDAVVGNPPYQSITGGGSEKVVAATQAIPIFNRFVEAATLLVPDYISMIIPARWYSGGIGLNEFRNAMLHDKRICKLFDFVDSRDCFTTADIAGGLCYFLWDANKPKPLCEVTNVSKETRVALNRSLDAFGDIFIRNNKAFSIIEKVKKRATSFVASSVSPIDAFGFPSKARGKSASFPGSVSLIHSQGTGYIKRSEVKKNADLIDKYKVTIGILVPCNGEVGIDPKKGYKSITTPRILKPNEVTTFSYLVLGSFKTKNEAVNFKKFMLCKFPRYMLRLTFSSMHISKQNFILVPAVDFTKEWTDDSLYDYFRLEDSERWEIEETMRKMEG